MFIIFVNEMLQKLKLGQVLHQTSFLNQNFYILKILQSKYVHTLENV